MNDCVHRTVNQFYEIPIYILQRRNYRYIHSVGSRGWSRKASLEDVSGGTPRVDLTAGFTQETCTRIMGMTDR